MCCFLPLTSEGGSYPAFAHSLYGHPLQVVARGMDNLYLDRMVRRYRTMHGNTVIDKDDSVRGLFSALRKGRPSAFSWTPTSLLLRGCSWISSAFRPPPPAAWHEWRYEPMPPCSPLSPFGIAPCENTGCALIRPSI